MPPIQLKHAHGPISIIIEFLPEIEQLKLQGLNTDFYDKVIPELQRKILNLTTFMFAKTNQKTSFMLEIEMYEITKRGQMTRLWNSILPKTSLEF